MWGRLEVVRYLNLHTFLLIMFGTILTIYLTGTFIDKLRILLFSRLIQEQALDRICKGMEEKAFKIYNSWDKEEKDE